MSEGALAYDGGGTPPVRERLEQGQAPPWVVPELDEDTPGVSRSGAAVPAAVRDAARRAFDARPVGMRVADLVFDSLVDVERAEPTQALTDPTVRTLHFGQEGDRIRLTVRTEAHGDRDAVSVRVEIRPPRPVPVEVRSPLPTFTVDLDAAGSVVFEVAPGLFSLVLRPPDGRAVQTSWVRL